MTSHQCSCAVLQSQDPPCAPSAPAGWFEFRWSDLWRAVVECQHRCPQAERQGETKTAFEPQSGEARWEQASDLLHEIAVQPWAGAQHVTQKMRLAKLVCCLCPKRGLTRADVDVGV